MKVRDEGIVRNKAVHIALGGRADGAKEILGLWLEQNEGAKFWLRVMNELRNRSVEDILLAVVDGLKGFPDAIRAVFPEAMDQTCVVHLLRHSLDFVSYKDRKPVAAALKVIYRAVDAEAGEAELRTFEEGLWGRRCRGVDPPGWLHSASAIVCSFSEPCSTIVLNPARRGGRVRRSIRSTRRGASGAAVVFRECDGVNSLAGRRNGRNSRPVVPASRPG